MKLKNRSRLSKIRQYIGDRKSVGFILFFSVLLSGMAVVGGKIEFSGLIWGGFDINYISGFQVTDLLLFLLGIVLGGVLLSVILHLTENVSLEIKQNDRKRFLILISSIIFIILLSWMPYILSFAPGSVLGDSLSSIRQVLEGYQNMNNHHPVIYTLFVGIFVEAGISLGDINDGVFLYTIVQSMIMSSVIAVMLCRLYRYGVSKIVITVFLAYYVVLPFFPAYAIIMWKDPLYSCGLLLMMLFLFEAHQTQGESLRNKKWLFCYCVSAVLCFFRNNGIYVLIVSILMLLLFYRKKSQKTVMIGLIIVILYCITNTFVFSALHIEKDFEENVGLPLQQLARVIAYDGAMADEEKEFLFQILPEENWKESYHPCLVDSIKWNDEFDVGFLEQNKEKFIAVWSSLAGKNLKLYTEAFVLNTFGFWTLGRWNAYGYIDIYIADNDFEIKNKDLFQKITGVSIQEKLKSFVIPVGEGWFIWLMLISVCLCLCKSYKSLIIYIPPVVNWMTILIATPVAFSLRYVYICVLALPMLIMAPFIVKGRGHKL